MKFFCKTPILISFQKKKQFLPREELSINVKIRVFSFLWWNTSRTIHISPMPLFDHLISYLDLIFSLFFAFCFVLFCFLHLFLFFVCLFFGRWHIFSFYFPVFLGTLECFAFMSSARRSRLGLHIDNTHKKNEQINVDVKSYYVM